MLEELSFSRNPGDFSGISCLVNPGRFTHTEEEAVKDPEQQKQPAKEATIKEVSRHPAKSMKMKRRRAQKAKKEKKRRVVTITDSAPQIECSQENALKNALNFTKASDPNKPSGLSIALYRNFIRALAK